MLLLAGACTAKEINRTKTGVRLHLHYLLGPRITVQNGGDILAAKKTAVVLETERLLAWFEAQAQTNASLS